MVPIKNLLFDIYLKNYNSTSSFNNTYSRPKQLLKWLSNDRFFISLKKFNLNRA